MKQLVGSLCLVGAIMTAVPVWASTDAPTGKPFPEVTFDRVSEIFGHNLDTSEERLQTLLLAIGMDHTTPTSPHFQEEVGIPFIVHYGPNHWVNRLTSGDMSVDVLVNNALLLLFAEADIPNREQAAFDLMKMASDKGYWPADYFVAETNLLNHLVRGQEVAIPLAPTIEASGLKQVARDTMDAFSRCAEIGFAPCRYRIGFWLSNSQKTLQDGLKVLQTAIDVNLKDTRYEDKLDGALVAAAQELAERGGAIGLDSDTVDQYRKLIDQYSRSAGRPVN